MLRRAGEPLSAEPVVEALARRRSRRARAASRWPRAVARVSPSRKPSSIAQPERHDRAGVSTRRRSRDPRRRVSVLDAVPAMAPAHVPTATAPTPERVVVPSTSATALLGATTDDAGRGASTTRWPPRRPCADPSSSPLVIEAAVEPAGRRVHRSARAPRELHPESRHPRAGRGVDAGRAGSGDRGSVKPVEPPALRSRSSLRRPPRRPLARERAAADAKPRQSALPQGSKGSSSRTMAC